MGSERTITVGSWEFRLNERDGEIFVDVPDCGGMADSVPRVPEQLAWAELAFGKMVGLERVWATTWRVAREALPELERVLREGGAGRG